MPGTDTQLGADGELEIVIHGQRKEANGTGTAEEVGAGAPPVDVGTTGNSSGYVPQPVTTAPEDWSRDPYVQLEGGFVAGSALGVVPFMGMGYQFLDEAKALPPQTPEARRGLVVGQIVGGFISLWGGLTGEVLGGIATVTGLGAAIGVPAIVVSTGLVLGGMGNIAAGIHGLMTTGSGSGSAKGTAGGDRTRKVFTPGGKRQIDAENAAKNHGLNKCENCGTDVVPGQKSQRGVSPPGNQRERDHIIPRSKGGDGSPGNGQVLCRDCNLKNRTRSHEQSRETSVCFYKLMWRGRN